MEYKNKTWFEKSLFLEHATRRLIKTCRILYDENEKLRIENGKLQTELLNKKK